MIQLIALGCYTKLAKILLYKCFIVLKFSFVQEIIQFNETLKITNRASFHQIMTQEMKKKTMVLTLVHRWGLDRG